MQASNVAIESLLSAWLQMLVQVPVQLTFKLFSQILNSLKYECKITHKWWIFAKFAPQIYNCL